MEPSEMAPMSGLKDLVDSINLPKAILDRADAFLRTLLGPFNN